MVELAQRRLAAVVEALRQHPRLGPQLVHVERLPGQAASFGELEPPLPEPLAAALAAGGAARLWSHQAEGLAAVRRGEDVLVTTPTASGKSLVFHLPVLEEAARGGPGRALFLYPLKALGQDQQGKLLELAAAAGIDLDCGLYDGDTPAAERARLRRTPPRVLITNPDMLHLGILPSWPTWGPFLADLRWVVLDELHTYRGIFGSHFHHVLERLLRLARELGARPQIVASSATAANADAFAAALTGRTFHRVAASGAPREDRHLLLVQPSGSPYTAALQLLVELLRQGQKTIVFTKARRITELLYSWLRQQEPALARGVASYRSGFLPEERRRIEARLFSGELQGVISTSALEMGIDVGGLDACVLVGWPGSVMATWQRSGRVGRQGRESLTALVALPDALDQWLLRHPEEIVQRPCEPLVVDPRNAVVARQHLPCAAAELPLERPADDGYLERHAGAVDTLLKAGALREAADRATLYAKSRRPHRGVGLRGGGETTAIVDVRRGRTIGTVDGLRVLRECHPGAIYLHAGRQYLVRELDLLQSRVLVEPAQVDWYTNALGEKDTRILEVLAERHEVARDAAGGAGVRLSAWLARLRVTEKVVGYERKRIFGSEVLSRHELELPPVVFESVGVLWAATPALEAVLKAGGRQHLGSLHAAEHAAISLLPLLALCDRGDIGGISTPYHPQLGCGAVFVYEGHPGGVGIAERGFAALPEWLGRVARLLAECSCDDGCPSCVQSPKCGNGNRPLDKAGALLALRCLLGETALPGAGEPWTLRLEEGEETVGAPQPSRPDPKQLELAGTPPSSSRGAQRRGDLDAAPSPPPRDPAADDGQSRLIRRSAPRNDGGGTPSHAAAGASTARRARPARASRTASPEPAPLELAGTPPSSRRSDPVPRHSFFPLAAALRDLVRGWWRRSRDTAPLPPGGTLLFDLETLRSAAEVGGWGNAHRMGVALAVVCHLEAKRFRVYRERDVEALAEALRRARLVVGYNVRRFDYRVLAGYTGADYNRLLPTLDLLEEVHRTLGFRLRMNDLALATLGSGKTADGLQSLAWVKEGRLDLVEAYCRKDVEVLRDLYLFGRREGYLLWRDRQERDLRLPVRW